VAVTVNVYGVPGVRPATVMGLLVPVAVMPPGAEVTVYCVIALPPFEVGTVKLMVACPLPLTAFGVLGAVGTVAGCTLFEATEATPVPPAFMALALNV